MPAARIMQSRTRDAPANNSGSRVRTSAATSIGIGVAVGVGVIVGVAVGGGVAVGDSVAVGGAASVAATLVGVSVGTAVFVGSSTSLPTSAGVSAGVSAGAVTLPEKATEATLVLKANKNAAVGSPQFSLKCVGNVMNINLTTEARLTVIISK